MRYSETAAVDAVYALVAELFEPGDPERAQPAEAMTIAEALVELGEDRSWASVWWSYGALHHDLSDAALEKSLGLLTRVDRPTSARAAALMLQAEIKYKQAVYAETDPSPTDQRTLLDKAAALAPQWPELHVRLAHACKAVGDEQAVRYHAGKALSLLASTRPTEDPFDSAISGRNLDPAYIKKELEALGSHASA